MWKLQTPGLSGIKIEASLDSEGFHSGTAHDVATKTLNVVVSNFSSINEVINNGDGS